MKIKIFQLLALIILGLSNISVSAGKELKKLKLVNVLSINKFYVPDYNFSSTKFEVPKNLSYEYFTRNAVDLPNSVKFDLYSLGVTLRNYYDLFLGEMYTSDVMRTQTTEFFVSIMTGELINAGLWPPVGPQRWKEDLDWQPIPFEYTPAGEDSLLLGTLCPRFQHEMDSISNAHLNLNKAHSKLIGYLRETGQIKISSILEMPSLYFALENRLAMNQNLPKWAETIFPDKSLLNATMAAYDLLSKTRIQKQLNGGTFLKTIVKNFNDHINGHLSNERKINVYIGDDRLFAGVLRNLNISRHDVPASGAAIIFELYAENDKYFVKIIHNMGSKKFEFLPERLVGCEHFCPIKNITELVANVLPEGDDLTLCYSHQTSNPVNDSSVPVDNNHKGSSSIGLFISSLWLIIPFLISIFDKTIIS